ncbi:ribonuclease P protein component [Candidatus Nitrosacidococcus tergens]|uniref:Ribonuclease P protein component n=1 Tax=Candidatus Nitrosacidococcus tergens TaxID=553981 RepID=A0A7G1QC45_9GAMM|nr:ribonuclease P protein component [Candidatus Nitrosacidococcus tergens]CAB1277642.1 Ribonuclease P protein component [Candidatus Nitrosacidococcus tergens]
MKQLSFTRLMRLHRPIEFKQVFTTEKKVQSKIFTIFYRLNELSYPRLGMVIPRRHLSRAFDRNQIKRLVREGFRHRQKWLDGYDLIILSKKCISRSTYSELASTLDYQWEYLIKDFNIE